MKLRNKHIIYRGYWVLIEEYICDNWKYIYKISYSKYNRKCWDFNKHDLYIVYHESYYKLKSLSMRSKNALLDIYITKKLKNELAK